MTLPNFPFLIYEWVTAFGANQGIPPNQHVDLSPRTMNAVTFQKGKQYELDTVQAAEANLTLANNDAALDPTNSSGPYFGQIEPYQGFRIQAQWPVTQNLLPQAVASGGEGWPVGTIPHTGYGTQNFNVYSDTDPTFPGTIVQPSGGAYSGASCFNAAVPSGSTVGEWVHAYLALSVVPGKPYSFQMRVRNVTASTSLTIQPTIGWFTPTSGYSPPSFSYGSTYTLTGSASAAWQLVTVTGTAPANAAGAVMGITISTTAAATCNVQSDVWQAEQASAPTTYTYPGIWYPVFNGFVERWPSEWGEGGTYGKVTPTLTDAFGLMSMGQLKDPLTEEINAAGAVWLYRCDDPSSASQPAEALGRLPALNTVASKYGAGTVTLGNSITAANPTTGIFTAGGVNPSVATFTVGTGGVGSASPTALSAFSLDESGIAGPATQSWTRMIAFRCATATGGSYIWTWSDSTPGYQGGSCIVSAGTGGAGVTYTGLSGTGASAGPNGNYADGNWHLMVFSWSAISPSGGTLSVSLDGGTPQTQTVAGFVYPSIVRDSFGGGGLSSDWAGIYGFSGDIAYAAEFPTVLTTTQISNIYSAWRNACQGESSSARYSRILRYAGFSGSASIQGTLTTAMGPATDLDGSDALTCLNNVVTTENGTHFVSSVGQPTFYGRGYRYNPGTPRYTFGEGSGEYPYEDLKLDFDSTHLANDVTVTQNSTGQQFFGVSSNAQSAFFDRTMSRTINVLNASEAQDCANFLVNRYDQPLTRIVSLVLNPGAQSALWPVALSLEVGMLIQVNRRPFGCPIISLPMWIEKLQWDFDDKGNAKVTLQCSPTIPTPQGQFTAWRTVLSATAASGQPTITVSPPTFDTVNPLDAYIYPGMSLTVHGSTTANYVVQSVQATGSSWSTGTITFTTNLSGSVSAGSQVSEVTSASSITAYDANSVFDHIAFTY